MPNFQSVAGFFFRFRGQIPLVFLLVLIPFSFWLAFPCYSQNYAYAINIISILLILIGVGFRAAVIAYKAPHTSGRNRHEQVAHTLNTTGMYSITQHPLYLGSFLIWMGISIRFNNLVFILGVLACSILFLVIIIKLESNFLFNKFRDQYERWSRETPAFYINPFKYKASNVPFDGIRVLATEYPTWVSILAGLLMIDLLIYVYFLHEDTIIYRLFVWIAAGLFIGFGGRFFKYVVVRRWLKRSI